MCNVSIGVTTKTTRRRILVHILHIDGEKSQPREKKKSKVHLKRTCSVILAYNHIVWVTCTPLSHSRYVSLHPARVEANYTNEKKWIINNKKKTHTVCDCTIQQCLEHINGQVIVHSIKIATKLTNHITHLYCNILYYSGTRSGCCSNSGIALFGFSVCFND